MRANSIVNNIDDFHSYLKGKKVALVFNGPKILKQTDGRVIDGMDVVIRFNKGYPEGKEEHVGSRTDVVMITSKKECDIERFPNVKIIIGSSYEWELKDEDVDFIARPVWPDYIYKFKGHPSSGMVMVCFAIDSEVSELHIFGHDTDTDKSWHTMNSQAKSDHNFSNEDEFYTSHAKDCGIDIIFH